MHCVWCRTLRAKQKMALKCILFTQAFIVVLPFVNSGFTIEKHENQAPTSLRTQQKKHSKCGTLFSVWLCGSEWYRSATVKQTVVDILVSCNFLFVCFGVGFFWSLSSLFDLFIERMTVLGRGLVFQPVLVTHTCTYSNNNIITLQNIDITDFPSNTKKKKKKRPPPLPSPKPTTTTSTVWGQGSCLKNKNKTTKKPMLD